MKIEGSLVTFDLSKPPQKPLPDGWWLAEKQPAEKSPTYGGNSGILGREDE